MVSLAVEVTIFLEMDLVREEANLADGCCWSLLALELVELVLVLSLLVDEGASGLFERRERLSGMFWILRRKLSRSVRGS